MPQIRYIGDGSHFVIGIPAADFETDDPAVIDEVLDYPELYAVDGEAPKPKRVKARPTDTTDQATDQPAQADDQPAKAEGDN